MVNKAILVGHLGKAPELRQVGGRPFCVLSVATSRRWTDKASGERRERTEWHYVEAWGDLAEQSSRFLAKGRLVYVEGRIETERWSDKASGQERQRVKIVASAVRFLGTKRPAATSESPQSSRTDGAASDEADQPADAAGAPDPVPPPEDSFEALPLI